MRHLKMISKIRSKITGLFWRSLLSYACVLFLPILICSSYFYHSYTTLKRHTQANQHLVLENAGEQINSIFRDVCNLASHLQLNRYVTALSNQKVTLNSSPFMDRYYLKTELAPLQISNALIQRINIYFPASGYIVNSVSTYEKELLSHMAFNANTLSLEDWDAILKELETSRLVCYTGTGNNFITIAQPLLTSADGQLLSVLCVQIDKKSLQKNLESRLDAEFPCSFLLTDETGILLPAGHAASDNAFPFTDDLISDIYTHFEEGAQGEFFEIKLSEKYIVDFYPLLIPQTALLFAAGEAGFARQMSHVLLLMLLSLLVCVLLGIVVIMYLSRKNYEPVSQIIHYIQGNGEMPEPGSDEYRFILKVLDKNRNEIHRQQEQIKNNYLQKIFTGEISFSQIPEPVAKQFCLELPSPYVCVVLFHVKEAEESGEISELTAFIIRNVYQELLCPVFADSYFSVQRHRIAVLVSTPDEESAPLLQLEAKTRQLLAFLSDSFQLSLRAGVSGIVSRENILDAYLQADTALEYERLFEAGPLCLYDSIPRKQTIGSLSLNSSEYVINLVTQKQRAQIQEYFDTLQKELKKNSLSSTDARSCYYFFYQVTAKLQLYCQTSYGICPEGLRFLGEDYFSQSLPSALSQACDAYLKTCDEIEHRGLSSVQWGLNICRFIENNYFDANLNLNSIVAHFQISPSYLSRKFKEQYQRSVIDYLYEIRIANSIPLLSRTELKIADIAHMTGFVDSNAFIRIFKKLKGTTPGSCRLPADRR